MKYLESVKIYQNKNILIHDYFFIKIIHFIATSTPVSMAAVFLFLICSFINDMYSFSADWQNTYVSLAVDLLLIFFIKKHSFPLPPVLKYLCFIHRCLLIPDSFFHKRHLFFSDDWQNTSVSLVRYRFTHDTFFPKC